MWWTVWGVTTLINVRIDSRVQITLKRIKWWLFFFLFFLQKHLDFPTFLPQFYHRTLQTSRTEGFDHDRYWIPLTQKQSSIHPSLWQFYANVCYFFFCESSESTELSRTFLPVKPLGWITSLHIWPFGVHLGSMAMSILMTKALKPVLVFHLLLHYFLCIPAAISAQPIIQHSGWNKNSIWGPLHPPWLLTNRCYNRGHMNHYPLPSLSGDNTNTINETTKTPCQERGPSSVGVLWSRSVGPFPWSGTGVQTWSGGAFVWPQNDYSE